MVQLAGAQGHRDRPVLTDGPIGVVDDFREQDREHTEWIEGFDQVVALAFARPDQAAYARWEPLAACRARLMRAVRPILHAHAGEDVVLVGHGTAWTVLSAALTDEKPDVDRWRALDMPDVIEVAQ